MATDVVVLVHGLWLSGWALALMDRRLRRNGFTVHRFSYPSVARDLFENAAALDRFVATLDSPVIHFVGHSLGGVVIQVLLQRHPPVRPGRIVTLGSPHTGSRAARQLAHSVFGRRLLGRSIAQLLVDSPIAHESEREIGIIRGDSRLGLGRLITKLPSPNDGVVSVDEAFLPEATDTITLDVSHSGMLISREVADQVDVFLKTGRFHQ